MEVCREGFKSMVLGDVNVRAEHYQRRSDGCIMMERSNSRIHNSTITPSIHKFGDSAPSEPLDPVFAKSLSL